MTMQFYWLLAALPLLLLGLLLARKYRLRLKAPMDAGIKTQSLETLYLNDSQKSALRCNDVHQLAETLSEADADGFYVMIELISQMRTPERDHLIHALDIVETRTETEQLLFGYLLVEKAKEVHHTKDPTESETEKFARAQELARLGIDALQGLVRQLNSIWQKDVYYHCLITAGMYTGDLAGKHTLWLTRLEDDLGQLPCAARSLCLGYSDQWYGDSQLCLSIARTIYNAAEPGSACCGMIVFAYDLIFYHTRFIEGRTVEPANFYQQSDIQQEILRSLKKWYAIKEKQYGFQRSIANDHIISVLLFLGYPQDALKALLRSHFADTVWCIKKQIRRTGLYQHVLRAVTQGEGAPQLKYLR